MSPVGKKCGDPSMLQGTNPRRLTWQTSGHVSNESFGSKFSLVAQIGRRHRSEGSGLWCLSIRSKGSSCRTITSLELAQSAVATDTYWSFWEGVLFSCHRQPFEVDLHGTYEVHDGIENHRNPQELVCLLRVAGTIVSDKGPGFSSKEFRQFTEANGIRHVLFPPYHPASNGAAERVVQVVKR